MSISTADFTLNPQLIALVLENLQTKSGFQAASKLVNLTPSGVIIGSLGVTEADWVNEGEKKPAKKGSINEVTIIGKKLAKVVPWTDEAGVAAPNLEQLLINEGLPSLALGFDKTVAGEKVAPTGFDTLTGTTVVNITGRQEFVRAVSSKSTEAGENTLVINRAMLSELSALTNAMGGAVLNIVGDELSGTINGTKYFVYASSLNTPKGFSGPFANKAYWGVLPGSVRIEKVYGSYVDEAGTIVHLDQENKKAMVVEGRFGFKLADKTLFNEITVIEPAEAP